MRLSPRERIRTAAAAYAIVIGMIAVGIVGPPHASAATETYTLNVSSPRCDGDSAHLVLRVLVDGKPVVGRPVTLIAIDGTVSLPGGGSTAEVNGVTDRYGFFRAIVTPPAGQTTRFFYALKFGAPNTDAFRIGTCPLSDDRSYVVDATMFLDRNGDGIQGPHERQLGGVMGLYGTCTRGCWYPLHSARAHRGVFEWTGLIQYPDSIFPGWHICAPRTITSVNGEAPFTVEDLDGLSCVFIDPLQPGVNTYKVGVQ